MDPRGSEHSLYLAPQASYKVAAAPRFRIETEGETLGVKQSTIKKPTLRSRSVGRKLRSNRTVAGAVNLQGSFTGLELLLLHLMGSVASGVANGDGLIRHTFTPTGDMLPGLTMVSDRDVAEVGKLFQFTGCQISKATFSQSQEDFLKLALEVEGYDGALIDPLGAPIDFEEFNGIDYEMFEAKIDGVAVSVEVAEVSIGNPVANRFALGSRLRKGQGPGGPREVTGKLDMEFQDLAHYEMFNDLDEHEVDIIYTGPVAAGASLYRLAFNFPRVVFGEGNPAVSDAGPIKLPLPFDAFATADGANDEVTIELDNLTVLDLDPV